MEQPAREGMLYMQGAKFGMKSWKRTWVMLFQASPYGIGRVELCDIRDGGSGGVAATGKQGLKKTDKKVIRLDDCVSITSAPHESCPKDSIAFYLNTTQRTYTLASEQAQEWITKLCQLAFQKRDGDTNTVARQESSEIPMEENELYSAWKKDQEYEVTVQKTEASARCCLTGTYLLALDGEAITLLDPQTKEVVYYWPYQLLRRFGQDKDAVTFEAGRRCESGEGHFTFLSKDVTKIYRTIEDAIGHQKKQICMMNPEMDAVPSQSFSHSSTQEHCQVMSAFHNRGSKTRQDQELPPEGLEKTRTPAPKPPRNLLAQKRTPKSSQQHEDSFENDPQKAVYATVQERSGQGALRSVLSRQHTIEKEEEEDEENIEEQAAEEEEEKEEDYWQRQEKETKLPSKLKSVPSSPENISQDYWGAYAKKPTLYDNMKSWEQNESEDQEHSPSSECLYALASFHKQSNKEKCYEEESEVLSPRSTIVTNTEIPVDFKQKLSDIFAKDRVKVLPALPARNMGITDRTYDN
ncbi:docking protein 3 [Lepisosteus oculatus]|uniref:docking protein 3 n=1 Tax=Lepisosteus oculatus TaxID=7918 RepID=UPI0035F52655